LSDAKQFSFPKELRLRTGAEFDAVFKAKVTAGDGVLVIHARPNELGHARLGMAVSRKVGNAVRRNRWKRCLREAFRLAQHDLPALDLVCLPRLRDVPTLEVVNTALRGLARRLEKKVAKQTPTTSEGSEGVS
jgi:ribonuclease P protein component